MRASVSMVRGVEEGTQRIEAHFTTQPQLINEGQQLDVVEILNSLNRQLEDFCARGSGWVLENVTKFTLHVTKYRPLGGPSSYIPTPEFLHRKKCLINVQNVDRKCFMYSVLAALFEPKTHKESVSQYHPFENSLNFDGLTFPIEPKDVPKFERQNQTISINILSLDESSGRDGPGFCVEYLSQERNRQHHVNLLLLDDGEAKRHYVYIKNISRLVAHRTRHRGKTYVCNSCLTPFQSQDVLERHVPYCIQHAPQQVIFPHPDDCEEDRIVKFRAHSKEHPIPIYLLSDFESFLSPINEPEREGRSTRLIDEHNVSGFCVYRVTEHVEHRTPPFVYSGPDPMSVFYDYIMAESRKISAIVTQNVSMLPLSPDQVEDYDNATTCGNCDGVFSKNNRKVHHHCHVSGKYQFAACNNCNLQLKPVKWTKKRSRSSTAQLAKESYEQNYFLPVVFHNLKTYDSHFIVKSFQRKYVERRKDNNALTFDDVFITPQNSEKYLNIQIGNVRFLDSFQFLSTSLSELVELLLKSGKHNFEHTSRHLGTSDDIYSKGIYPYNYMTSRDKFSETRLPPIEAFHDGLKDEPLTAEDYARAQQVWVRYNMTNMQHYHDHYLLTDVLLLADVFEHFRQTIRNEHKLDCLHFITLPSLAWATALKHTQARLDLITDADAYLMIENSMRGGIATISQRYASANNPYVDGYDESKEKRYITYLDANSLYATAQSEPLPVGNFRFLSDEEMSDFDLDTIEADAEIGYIVECDLEYPSHLHDMHNDYPMAPEHLTVEKDMLSPFAVSLLDPDRPWKPTKKLVPNLMHKTKYTCHYRNLQLYKRHGLVITNIHRILSFTQSTWLKPWIDLCNQRRREARSEFESDLAKLQANATFGKTMEQIRNRVNIRLIADSDKVVKAVSKPSFRESEIVNSELVMVRSAKSKIKMTKPISVGFAILELSKLIMYEHFYDHLKAKYGERCSLLFTDTDSLCCEIRTDDLYDDMGKHLELYDTSNFDPNHPQYSETNRRVLGKFKSETGSVPPKEFVGLRAKMYSLHVPGDPTKCQKKAKGIQKHYVRTRLPHEQFVDVLRNVQRNTTCKFRVFKSTNHVVNSVEIKKLCLCAFDDKRYILDDGVHTLAYGHYSTCL